MRRPGNLDDLADEGEDIGNDLNNLFEIHFDGDTRVEAQHKLDRLLALLGWAVDWHSGIHFEPDFDPNAIEH